MSGKSYLKLIDRLRAQGWTVQLFYLALPSSTVSKLRVAERVSHGGHNIPVADIERRYPRSLKNLFTAYSMKVDRCRCYLNIGYPPLPVFEQYGQAMTVQNAEVFGELRVLAGLD